MPPSLLLPSDDSDGGEVDAVTRRVKRRQRCKEPWTLNIYLILTLTFVVGYLTYSHYVLRLRFNEMNEIISGELRHLLLASFLDLILLPARLRVVEEDIHRLRMEFDLSRYVSLYFLIIIFKQRPRLWE